MLIENPLEFIQQQQQQQQHETMVVSNFETIGPARNARGGAQNWTSTTTTTTIPGELV